MEQIHGPIAALASDTGGRFPHIGLPVDFPLEILEAAKEGTPDYWLGYLAGRKAGSTPPAHPSGRPYASKSEMKRVEVLANPPESGGQGEAVAMIDRHQLRADECPGQSMVVLASSMRKLLANVTHPPAQAIAALIASARERDALRAFANEVMDCWPDGGPDGGDLQDMAEKHGLLAVSNLTVPCGDNCGCTEFYGSGDVADCYRKTPLLTGKIAAD